MRHTSVFTVLGTQLRGYPGWSAPGRLDGLARNAEYVLFAFFAACLLLFWLPSESRAEALPSIDDFESIVHECSDGVDNDGDSYVDYPDDPDCADEMDEAERTPTRLWRGSAVFEPLPQPESLGAPLVFAVSGDGSVVVGAASAGPDPSEYVASVIWRDGIAEVIDDVRGLDPDSQDSLSAALGISDDGRVIVGYHSYRYEENGEMRVGTRAYRYENGLLEDLALPDPEIPGSVARDWSGAADASDVGTIVGIIGWQPGRWDQGVPTILGPSDPSRPQNAAMAVSRDGSVIVGRSDWGVREATVWHGDDLDGTPLFPENMNQAWGPDSTALAVSNDGSVIVGYIDLFWAWDRDRFCSGAPCYFGFRWHEGSVRSFGPSADDVYPPDSIIFDDVSGDGSLAVGTANRSGPVVSDEQRLRTLRDLLVNEYDVDLQGWAVDAPDLDINLRTIGISADGRTIAGVGLRPDGAIGAWKVRLPPACSDGLDNDGDGFIDYPEDPGCVSRGSGVEDPECDDGVDNDGDGATDDQDVRCLASWDRSEACGLGFELALLLPPLLWLRQRRR